MVAVPRPDERLPGVGVNTLPLTPVGESSYAVLLGSVNHRGMVSRVLVERDVLVANMDALVGKHIGEYRFSRRLEVVPYGPKNYRADIIHFPRFRLDSYELTDDPDGHTYIHGVITPLDLVWFNKQITFDKGLAIAMRTRVVTHGETRLLKEIVSFDIEPPSKVKFHGRYRYRREF